MSSISEHNLETTLDILGKKWTGLIIYALAECPKRFCGVERAIPELNPRTLSKRLDELEQHGIIRHDNNGHYQLTAKGTDLLPILKKMSDWGEKYPQPPASLLV